MIHKSFYKKERKLSKMPKEYLLIYLILKILRMKKENKPHFMPNNLNMILSKIFQLKSKSFLKFKRSSNYSNCLKKYLQLKILNLKKGNQVFLVKVLQGDSV
jgi:hypothetical protein